MQEADLAMTQNAMRDHDRFRGDENLYVKFFIEPLQDRAASLEAGRPIFLDTEFISIMVPGDKDNIVVREIRDQDKQRFPRQYAAFKNNEQELVDGTPLGEWGFLSKAQVAELEYFNIRTVEQLANVTDANAQKFMGINKLKQRAQEYLEASKGEAPILQLQEELATRDVSIIELRDTVEALQSRLKTLEGGEPDKKPGFFSKG